MTCASAAKFLRPAGGFRAACHWTVEVVVEGCGVLGDAIVTLSGRARAAAFTPPDAIVYVLSMTRLQ